MTDATSFTQPLALVCVDDADRLAAVSGALDELGYRSHVGTSTRDVLDWIRRTSYDVIVLDEAWEGSTPLDHPLLRSIQGMPMATRRYVFVALLGPDLTTLDQITAFARSVNLVVSYDDVPTLTRILARAISDNEQFYRVFRQALQDAGKR